MRSLIYVFGLSYRAALDWKEIDCWRGGNFSCLEFKHSMCASTALKALNNLNRLNYSYGCQATTDTNSGSQKDAENDRGSFPARLGFHDCNLLTVAPFKFIDCPEEVTCAPSDECGADCLERLTWSHSPRLLHLKRESTVLPGLR